MAILNGTATIAGVGSAGGVEPFSTDFSSEFHGLFVLSPHKFIWAGGGAYLSGPTTLLSSELNALASSSGNVLSAASSAVQNTAGYIYADVEFIAGGTYTPTASGFLEVWFLASLNGGTNYEDGSAVIGMGRPSDIKIPIRAGTTIQPRAIARGAVLPPAFYKAILRNQSGATLPATGNILRFAAYAEQY